MTKRITSTYPETEDSEPWVMAYDTRTQCYRIYRADCFDYNERPVLQPTIHKHGTLGDITIFLPCYARPIISVD